MTYDDTTTGLDLFDETASAVGNFPQALRGYDKGAVDAYVRDVEAQLSRAKAQLRQQQKQLTAASARAEDTDFSKLGAHARGMLRAAESQSEELVSNAQSQAKRIIDDAEAKAAKLSAEAQQELDASQAASTDKLHSLRQQLSDQSATELQGAKDEASMIRAAAQREADQLITEARAKSDALLSQARTDAEAMAASVERETTEERAKLIAEREAKLAEIKANHQSAAAQLDELVSTARQHAEAYQAKIDADSITWSQRRDAALAESEEIVGSAKRKSTDIITSANNEAKVIHAKAVEAGEAKKAKLEAKLELLSGRHKAILAQLGELSALAGKSMVEYGDEKEADEASGATDASPAPAAQRKTEVATEAATGDNSDAAEVAATS